MSTAPPPEPLHVGRPLLPSLDRLRLRLEEVWAAGRLTNGGAQTRELEARLGDAVGTPHVAVTGSGTMALLLALAALDLEPGCEVVTTPFTFPATPHALVWNRLQPVFADVDPATGNLDPRAVAARIGPRTRAILAVHVYGRPCDVAALGELARRHDLRLVYDAAHAFGARVGDLGIGAFGDLSAFSLHSTKLLHSAEGGAVACRDATLLERVARLRNFGIGDGGVAVEAGLNGKLNEVQAALALAVMDELEAERHRRRELADLYGEELAGVPGLEVMAPTRDETAALVFFALRIDPARFGCDRERVETRLREIGVLARPYFHPLVSELPPYRDLPSAAAAELPVASALARQVLCLPFHGGVTREQALRVCADIQDCAGDATARRARPAPRRGTTPLVSVTMPTFDNEAHVERAIASVLGQTFTDFELVVVDDGSRDGTLARVRRFDDPRLVVVAGSHQGGAEATNEAIRRARGRWIALFAADDECHPERLERQLAFAAEHDARAVFTGADFIDDSGRPLAGPHFAEGFFNHPDRPRPQMLRHFFFHGNYLCTPSALLDRALLEDAGLFPATLAQLPDFATWLRLVGRTDLRLMPDRLVRYRVRDGETNVSGPGNAVRSQLEHVLVSRSFFATVPLELFRAAFAADLRRRDFAPGIEHEIEKALLFLRHPIPAVRLLGPERLAELLRSPAVRRVARERYDLGPPELFAASNALDAGRVGEHAALHRWAIELETSLHEVHRDREAKAAALAELETYVRHLLADSDATKAEYGRLEGGYLGLERHVREILAELETVRKSYRDLEHYARGLEREVGSRPPVPTATAAEPRSDGR